MRVDLVQQLIKIKNACILNKEFIDIKYKSHYLSIIKLLYKEGFVQSFKITSLKKKHINVILRLARYNNALRRLKIISTPSHKKFINYLDICKVSIKKRVFFITTTGGVLSNVSCKKLKLGGSLLFSC
jgi:small subunit ribosomal protein S8